MDDFMYIVGETKDHQGLAELSAEDQAELEGRHRRHSRQSRPRRFRRRSVKSEPKVVKQTPPPS